MRTRLSVLAAFALVALAVAFFVAWRLARATETFALRQADSSLHAAARDLARAVYAHPSGYQTVEEAAAPPEGPGGPRDVGPRGRPVPPHVRTLFAAYRDPLSRLTAITLHRFPYTVGGFYRADATLVGIASPANDGAGGDTVLSSDMVDTVRALAKQANDAGSPASRTINSGSDRIIIVAYPIQADGPDVNGVTSRTDAGPQNSVTAAWAVERLSNITGVSDRANIAALALLILSVVAVSGLALTTVRDLRYGVSGIEQGLTSLTRDLSQQIKPPLTPELARITAAINQLADTLRVNLARQAELERDLRRSERLSALGRLVAGVAHEVRNPLAAIKLKAQMARRARNSPDGMDDTFRVITEEIDRLDALVRRLLEFGRTQPLEQNRLDLCELVRRRAALFNDVAERSNATIEVRPTEDEVVVEGDAERLSQVLDNLIQNALDAMPGGGRVTISCDAPTNEDGKAVARVGVEDTGRGISEADRERVFEPFFTGRETGTGLGLAISREIVEAHGGRIHFVSREGGGTLFMVELPLRSEVEGKKESGGRSVVGSGDVQ